MKNKFKIQVKHFKQSKNTIVSYLQVVLNDMPIIEATVKGNKSISAFGIQTKDSWIEPINSKNDIVGKFGDYWDKGTFYPITKKIYHSDELLYKIYIEYKSQVSTDPEYVEDLKPQVDIFTEKYGFLIYGPIQKRHMRQKRRKYYFKPKMVQAGTDAEVNEALEFWKTFYKS